jgi:hypothetical protein
MTNSPRHHYFCRKIFNALVIVLAVFFSAFLANAQQPEVRPRNPPALPSDASSSRPVPPESVPAAPFGAETAGPTLGSSVWAPIGPASLQSGGGLDSGRITGVAVDPTNSNNIYIAAAGGGVWNTTNGGTTWTALTDGQTTLSMGSIAIAPTDHLKIYAGTGEANNSLDSNHGNGILVSNNGGSTWTLETAGGAFAGVEVGQIAIDPTNENTAYAAVGGYGENASYFTNAGIWKTTNGGTTWTNLTSGVEPYSTDFAWTAVVVDPNTPSIIYAAAGDIEYSTYSGYTTNGVYRSTNSGTTWALLSNAPNGSSNSATGRIALAVSPAAKSSGLHVLYAAVESLSTSGLLYFVRSDNADAATPTFTDLTSGTPNFMGSQGWYDIGLNVDANGVVYADGVSYGSDILRSTNLGVTWNDITVISGVEPHTDHHAIVFDSSNRMLDGNDGGIWRYDSTVPSWTDLNGNLNTIQLEGIGLHPTSETTVVGGSQDNGTELYSNNTVWSQVDGGDGGFAQFSQTNPSYCYAVHTVDSFGSAGFFRVSSSSCASGTFVPETTGFVNANSDFYPPFVVDPTNGSHLLIGLDRVYETTNAGALWTPISTPGSNGFDNVVSSQTYNVDTVALAAANESYPATIYAATGGGSTYGSSLIFVSTNDGGSWTEHNLPICTSGGHYSAGCKVNQIVADPNDPTNQTAVAVTSNFTGTSGGHVYGTTNAGATWTDISSGLPDLPTWSAQIDTDPNQTIYVSNDTGVYSSTIPYTTWSAYGTGLPNAQGYDLELNRSFHVLAVATHGRGAWEILTPSTYSPALMTSPAPGSTLTSASTTFTWSAGSGGTITYYLWVGTTPDGYDLENIGPFSGTSTTVNLPTNGATIYVRLWTVVNGTTELSNNYAYTEFTRVASVIASPTPGNTLTSASTTFTWNAGPAGTTYGLNVGTSLGGSNLVNIGPLSGTSATVTLPTNGTTIYVRLWTIFNGSTYLYNDYTYTEFTQSASVIASPSPGSTLTSAATTFTWNAGPAGTTGYGLNVGTSLGGANLVNIGPLSGTSTTVTLPTNGATIYVRLWTILNGTTYLYNDYTYTEFTRVASIISSPTPGSTLTSASTTFTWNAGPAGTTYGLNIGTTGVGSADLLNIGPLSGTSVTVTLPTNGTAIYVRLWTIFNGTTYVYNDYTYTEFTRVASIISSPTPGSTLTSASTTFTWNAGPAGTTGYGLNVGTSLGGANLVNIGPLSGTSVTVNLPTNGTPIFVRLWTILNGTTYLYNDYTYTEAP